MWHILHKKCTFLSPAPLRLNTDSVFPRRHDTLIIEDVFGVGEHAGEYAAEEQPAQTCPDEQEDCTGVENKQHQHGNYGASLEQNTQRRALIRDRSVFRLALVRRGGAG